MEKLPDGGLKTSVIWSSCGVPGALQSPTFAAVHGCPGGGVGILGSARGPGWGPPGYGADQWSAASAQLLGRPLQPIHGGPAPEAQWHPVCSGAARRNNTIAEQRWGPLHTFRICPSSRQGLLPDYVNNINGKGCDYLESQKVQH